jgi:hypothetical protein
LPQGQAVVGIQTMTTYSADARIMAVDTSARTHTVSSAAATFGATRIGDVVTIAFKDRLTFVLRTARRRRRLTAT